MASDDERYESSPDGMLPWFLVNSLMPYAALGQGAWLSVLVFGGLNAGEALLLKHPKNDQFHEPTAESRGRSSSRKPDARKRKLFVPLR